MWHERIAGIATCLGVKTGILTIAVVYCCGGWTSRAVSKLSYLRPSVNLFNLRNQSSFQNNPNEDSIFCVQTALFEPKIAPTSVPIQINMSDDNSLVAALSPFYIGLGVPMEASAEAGNIQMCALVGHGGRLKPCKASKKQYSYRRDIAFICRTRYPSQLCSRWPASPNQSVRQICSEEVCSVKKQYDNSKAKVHLNHFCCDERP